MANILGSMDLKRNRRQGKTMTNFQLALGEKRLSIYFIQEAHCTEDKKHDWRAEWVYRAFFSCASSKKAGATILFNNNFNFQISKVYSDHEGRFNM